VGERIKSGTSSDSKNDKYNGNELYIKKVTNYYLYLKRRYNQLFIEYFVKAESKHLSKIAIKKIKEELKKIIETLEEIRTQIRIYNEAKKYAKEHM